MLAEFNLFRVLGITRDELSHSAFLAWLLNPRQTHGLGDYVLRRFLIEAAAEARSLGMSTISPVDVDAWRFLDVEVATERHNIDILLIGRNDGFVCVIENKIGASEQPNQLEKYLKTVKSVYPKLTPLPVFLTPRGTSPEKPSDALSWIPFGYARIANLVQRILNSRGSTIGPNVRSFVEQYETVLRRHVMGSADNIEDLAYRLYEKHRAAFNFIDGVKSAPGLLELDVLDEWVTECADALVSSVHNDYGKISIRRFSSTHLDPIVELHGAGAWRGTDLLVLFELLHDKKGRNLRADLVVGPGDATVRERVFTVAKKVGQPFGKFKPTAKHPYIHVAKKHILTPRTYHPFDQEKTKEAAKKGIVDWYGTDYPVLVNAIRAEFGLPPVSQL